MPHKAVGKQVTPDEELERVTRELEELKSLIAEQYCEAFALAWMPVTTYQAVTIMSQTIRMERTHLRELPGVPVINSMIDFSVEGARLWRWLRDKLG